MTTSTPDTWEDPILTEIRRIREEHAKSFNHDIEAMAHDHQVRGKAIREEWERKQRRTAESTEGCAAL